MARLPTEIQPSVKSPIPSSFRDPSGSLYLENGELFRQINSVYKENFDHLITSGLYDRLVDSELLIRHDEVTPPSPLPVQVYKIIKPERLTFISYPYEWCFSQLRHAALITLRIQKEALSFGMSLKDCSAYNIQFRQGKPILIDTLSFEKYQEGKPWVAYRQFCKHFLAPLALMAHTDIRLSQLFRISIDGVDLDLASSLLPLSTRLKFSLLTHVHLHSRTERHFADKKVDTTSRRMSRTAFLALLDNLESAVNGLKWRPDGTHWANYYEATNYTSPALQHKMQLVSEFLGSLQPTPRIVWDLGANTGLFSRIATAKGIQTISFDNDPACIEKSYLEAVDKAEPDILPLLVDLANPSSSIGWANEERMSLIERGPADAAMALALIHHLAISNNLPFSRIADFLSRICNTLIIEFVPKSDSQVQRLLRSREDIFPTYTEENFQSEFGEKFFIDRIASIRDTERSLFLMRRRPSLK